MKKWMISANVPPQSVKKHIMKYKVYLWFDEGNLIKLFANLIIVTFLRKSEDAFKTTTTHFLMQF